MADHAKCRERVSTWLCGAAKELSNEETTRLVSKAITALLGRVGSSISPVTTMAILDRALFLASEDFPDLRKVQLQNSGLDFSRFEPKVGRVSRPNLLNGLISLVTEFICIMGNLTADLFTEEFFDELENPRMGSSATFSKKKKGMIRRRKGKK